MSTRIGKGKEGKLITSKPEIRMRMLELAILSEVPCNSFFNKFGLMRTCLKSGTSRQLYSRFIERETHIAYKILPMRSHAREIEDRPTFYSRTHPREDHEFQIDVFFDSTPTKDEL